MKNILKKIIAVFMVAVMTVVCAPIMDLDGAFSIEASALTGSGSMGGDVKWNYNTSSKTLTISGSGNMSNYSSTPSVFTKYQAGLVCYINRNVTKIVINNGVTNIGNYAFADLTKVTSVTIAGSVTSIGSNAFKGCTSLTSVTISSGVKTIGERAFYGCTSLKSITVPASVTSLGKSAFEGCSALSTVNLNSGLQTIGDYCFKNTKYSNVSLPSTVTSIGDYAFANVNPTFTCSYGDVAYSYCKKNSFKYMFVSPVMLISNSFDTDNMTVDLTLKLVSDSTKGAAVNAGNFTLTYNDSVIPVAPESGFDCETNGGVTTAVVYGTNSIGIAVMAEDAVSYVTDGYETSYTIVQLSFNVNGQADNADFVLSADTLMLNGSRINATAADVSINLHEYSTSFVDKAATCCEKGLMHYTCSLCLKEVNEDIPLNSSNHEGGTEIINVLNENCGTAGYSGDLRCLGCGEVIQYGSDIAATGDHSYSSAVTTVATCSTEGVLTYTCSVCNDQYSEAIKVDSSNHTGDTELRDASAATCGADGYTGDTYCKSCGAKTATGTIITATGEHTTEIRNAAEATCGAAGYTGDVYCTTCNSTILSGTVLTATGVHDYIGTVTTEATCTSTGIMAYTCSVCDNTYTEEIDKNTSNHIGETELRDAKDSTCSALGYTGDTYCVSCGELISVGTIVDATGEHQTEIRDTIAATCISDGYTGDTYCTVCNELLEAGQVIAATGEHQTEIRDAIAATCISDGYTGDVVCTVCNSVIEIGSVVESTGEHTQEVVNAVAATCISDGYTGDTYCTVCNELLEVGQVIVSTGEHTMEIRNAAEATCSADGYTGDTYCTVCNTIISSGTVLPATGVHDYIGTVTTEATCNSTGIMTYTCSVCDNTYTEEIDKDTSNHTGETELRDAKDAICGEAGYTGDTYCTACSGLVEAGQTIAATGEHQTEIRDAVAATCSVNGYTGDTYCTVCGEKIAEGTAVEATGHVTEVRDAVAVTCLVNGYTGDTYCKVCGEKIAEGSVIAATGEHKTEVKNAVTATCGTDGYTGDTYCTLCGEKLAGGEAIAATGEHDYVYTVITAADCTTEGETDCTCSVCGKSGIETIEPVGHSYVEVVVDPTCIASGYTIYTCSVCEASYRGDNVSSLGHDYDENGECTRCDDVKVTEIVFIQNNYIEVTNINVNTNGGSETPDNAGDSENTVVQVIISKTSSISAADFLAYVEGENWSIMDAEGNAVDSNSFVATDCSISNAGGIEYKIVILGDINHDGTVTAADARLALRNSAKLEEFSDVQSLAADVDSTEVVNASDARVILRVSAKMETF